MCDREYPKHAIAAVGAVLIKNGRVLLVKRGFPPAVGKWSIPGGAIEPGEGLTEAALRELEEETGLRAKPLGVVHILNNIVFDGEGNVKYHYLVLDILFDSTTIEGMLKPGGDAIGVEWMDIDEALKRDDVSRTTKKLLHKIKQSGFSYTPLDLELNEHRTFEQTLSNNRPQSVQQSQHQ